MPYAAYTGAGRESATFVTECNQMFCVAVVTPNPQETVFETAASYVTLELALDALRQCHCPVPQD